MDDVGFAGDCFYYLDDGGLRPGTQEERIISGVPITVNLNEYVVNEYNLRIVEGANATASVKVSGTRSEIASLTAQDITVTAAAGQISKEGAYVLPLRATSSGDFSFVGSPSSL